MKPKRKPVYAELPGETRVLAMAWPDGRAVVFVDPVKFPGGGEEAAAAATLREVLGE